METTSRGGKNLLIRLVDVEGRRIFSVRLPFFSFFSPLDFFSALIGRWAGVEGKDRFIRLE